METGTVANAAHTGSGTPAPFPAAPTRQSGTAGPSRGRGTWTAPDHLTRITEAAAVAAVHAFYGARS